MTTREQSARPLLAALTAMLRAGTPWRRTPTAVAAANRDFRLRLPEPDEYLIHLSWQGKGLSLTAAAMSYASLNDRALYRIAQSLSAAALSEGIKAVSSTNAPFAPQLLSLLREFSADAWARGITGRRGSLWLAFDPQTGKAVLLTLRRLGRPVPLQKNSHVDK